MVNRVGYDTGQISLKKAQETIGREIFWQIPNDYRVMVEVRNNGVPLIQQARKAAITQSIGQLADALSGKHEASDDAGQQGPQLARLLARQAAAPNRAATSVYDRHNSEPDRRRVSRRPVSPSSRPAAPRPARGW